MWAFARTAIFVWLIHTMRVFSNLPLAVAIVVWVIYGIAFGLYVGLISALLSRIRQRFGIWWPAAFAGVYIGIQSFTPQLFPWSAERQV